MATGTPYILRNFKLHNESTGLYLTAGEDGIASLTPLDPQISGRGVFYYYPDWQHLALLSHVDAATGQPQFIRLSSEGFVPKVSMFAPDNAAPHKMLLYFNGKLLSADAQTTVDTPPSAADTYTLIWASTVFYLTNGSMYLSLSPTISMTEDRSKAQEFEFLNDNIILHGSYVYYLNTPWQQWTVARLVLGGVNAAAVQTVAVSQLGPGNLSYAKYFQNITQLCYVGGRCATLTVPGGGALQTVPGVGNDEVNLSVWPYFPPISRRHSIVAVQYPRNVRQAKSLQLDGATQVAPIVLSVIAVVLIICWWLVGFIRSNLIGKLLKGNLTPLDKATLVNLTWYPKV